MFDAEIIYKRFRLTGRHAQDHCTRRTSFCCSVYINAITKTNVLTLHDISWRLRGTLFRDLSSCEFIRLSEAQSV